MKIIKPGNLQPVEKTCHICGCIFEYTPIDIKYDTDLTGINNYVNCPCCMTKIYINKNTTIISPWYPYDGTFGPVTVLPCREIQNDSKTDIYRPTIFCNTTDKELDNIKEILKNGQNQNHCTCW